MNTLKVNVKTWEFTQELPPKKIRKFDEVSLQNLQTTLNPVPADLVDIEYWPVKFVVPTFNEMIEHISGETVALDKPNKKGIVTAVVSALSAEVIAELATTAEAEAVKLYGDAVQDHLDAECVAHIYDGILSLCTYATSPTSKFSSEGQAGVNWRDACWSYTYAQLAAVKSGEREAPTPEALVLELPAMVWPS